MAEPDFPHASIIEGVRFTAQVAIPNVVQGLFRRRRKAVAVATRTGADKRAVRVHEWPTAQLWRRAGVDQDREG